MRGASETPPHPQATNRSVPHLSETGHLKVPKLRRQKSETAIIERYRRRESSVEEALIEMYLAVTPFVHPSEIRVRG